jgi:hypothetical protein
MFNRCFNDFFDFTSTDFKVVEKSVQQRLQQWQEFQQVVVPAIADRTWEVKDQMKQRMDSKVRVVEALAPGTVVWALDHTRKSKWDPVREGPFTVVRQTEGGAYELKDATNTILPTKRTIEILTVQEGADTVKVEHLESYEVEEILKHKEGPSGFEYLVKWKNCPASDNSWVKQDRFDDVLIIRKYWERVNVQHKKGARRSERNATNKLVSVPAVQDRKLRTEEKLKTEEKKKEKVQRKKKS